MATPFPSRPYTGLSRGGGQQQQQPQQPYQNTRYNTSTPFNAPPSQGPYANTTGAGPSATTHQARESARLEREREERQRREAEEAQRSALDHITEEQREEVNEAFQLFDLDKDDHIDYHELRVALKALGFDLPKSEILALLQEYGVPASSLPQHQHAGGNHDGKTPGVPSFSGPSRLLLSRDTFAKVAAERIQARDPQEEIMRAFELFDLDGKGRIELSDLRRVARELGEGLQEDELAAMIEEFDVRGEGGIDRDAFLGICLGG